MTESATSRWELDYTRLGATAASINGVPTLLLEATRRVSQWEGIEVPHELVTIWPVHTVVATYTVMYRHPETGERHDLPDFLELPGRFPFETYQRWLEDAQAVRMEAVEKRFQKMNRGWWRW